MPDNSSGYIDFNQYSEQNGADEQQRIEQAMQRAEAAQGKAQGALRKSELEGAGRYGKDGQITGEKSLSQTASYSDYLKASQEATAAWAAVNSRSKDPRLAALQGSLGGPGRERSAQAMAAAAAQEKSVGTELDGGVASLAVERTQRAAEAAAKAKAAKERADFDAGNKAAFNADIQKRISKVWGGRDTRATATWGGAGAEGWQAWTPDEIGQMDELGRLSKQAGTYDAWGKTGAWDTDTKYGPDGNIGVSPDNKGNVTYYVGPGSQGAGIIGRRGGFKGWGT